MSILIARAKRGVRPQRRFPSPAAQAGPLQLAAPLQLHVFQSELGWMAALGREGSLVQLVIGCESPVAAVARLDARWTNAAEEARWCASLARRLQAYAAGSTVSFDDVPVEIQDRTSFQVRVLECCRNIGRGQTISYGELARLAGRPGAARAVGNVMAGNRCPLVIPCHRVVHADGRIGRFSAPQGARLKRRLLELEC